MAASTACLLRAARLLGARASVSGGAGGVAGAVPALALPSSSPTLALARGGAAGRACVAQSQGLPRGGRGFATEDDDKAQNALDQQHVRDRAQWKKEVSHLRKQYAQDWYARNNIINDSPPLSLPPHLTRLTEN